MEKGVLSGQGECVEDFVEKYSKMVYRLAVAQMKNKSDADDVFQEVFLRYIKKQPVFKSQEHEKAWFIRVTLNCCASKRSSVWAKRVLPLEESLAYEDFYSEEHNTLLRELQKLPQKYSSVIHLFYYEEMSIEEISSATGVSRAAVKTRLSRARSKLREILKEEDYV